MLAFDLVLLEDLLAVDADLVVIASRSGGEDKIFAGLVGLVRCGVTDAARGLVFGAPPLFLVVGDVGLAGSLGVCR